MTRNTISYKEYEERRRSNLANENLKAQELAHKRNELAETVANNMRNYGINVSKNQIQKLANDQLNSREISKLTETIRSNLRAEETRLLELAERTADNQEKRKLEKQANEIKEMDSLLQAAKATGKTPETMLISWITNQANLSAFGGKNVLTQLFPTPNRYYDEGTLQRGYQLENLNNTGSYDQYYVGRSQSYHGNKTRAKGKETISDPRFIYSKRNERYDNENEIPEDYSNSYGPQGRNHKGGHNNENVVNESSQYEATRNRISETGDSYGDGRKSSQSKQTSRIIYSPGAKENSERRSGGPGIGLAFN